MEGVGVRAVQDVRKTRRVGEAEDSPSVFFYKKKMVRWCEYGRKWALVKTYEGLWLGEQTIAMLSGIMT